MLTIIGCATDGQPDIEIEGCYNSCDALIATCEFDEILPNNECYIWCEENLNSISGPDPVLQIDTCFECIETDAMCNSRYIQEFCYKPCNGVIF